MTSARPTWLAGYVRALVLLDAAFGALGALLVVLIRYDGKAAALGGIDYRWLAVAYAAPWTLTLALSGCYDRRVLGVGTEEFRRVLGAAVRAVAALAVVVVAAKADVARSVIGIGLPVTAGLTLLGRWGARQVLHQRRRRGRWLHRVVVVGTPEEVLAVLTGLRRHREAGMEVVGACATGDLGGAAEVLGGPEEVAETLDRTGADTVVVAGTAALGEAGLRRLAWSLEGRGVDLLVAPGLTYVAVPRIVFRPVDGNPLLHVEEPRLSGAKQALKTTADRVVAAAALLVLSPVLALLALAVVLSSGPPVLYRQTRCGREGRTFGMWKLRTMVRGADALSPEGNDASGALFKLRQDPRVTPVGRVLRRWSLDELPQLVNVLTGSMSLVGPRPPLPGEVEQYGEDVRRRMLVRPGMTGLWQVSGRSDLPWDEAVRLDLQYVENWSLSLDAVILLRTLMAVLRRTGAY